MRPAALVAPALLGLALLSTAVSAQEYRTVDDGGPLTLSEDVAAAADAWNEAIGEEVLREGTDAEAVFRFADPQRIGPDTSSLTVTRVEDGVREVWLDPDDYRDTPQVLLHELGILLGLPAGDSGVMSPLLSAGGPTAPTPEDIATLAAVRERIAGDLDGDGVVGLADLALLGRAFGTTGVNLPADLDGDGTVGASDIELLRRSYRFVAPAPNPTGEEPSTTESSDDPGSPEPLEEEGTPDENDGQDVPEASPDGGQDS